MKLRMIYTFFALLIAVLLGLNNSSGPAAVQGLDRTGSPLSPGPCQTCHAAGAFSPSLNLQVLENGEPITDYIPGNAYQLRVEINASGASGYGFQAVALSGDEDQQAGAFLDPPPGIQVTPLNSRQYAEHSQRSDSNVFEIDWQAPAAGGGEVRFYSAVVAANGNGSSGGDGSVFLTEPVRLAESVTSGTVANELFEAFTVFPNPVQHELSLRFQSREQGEYQVRLVNLQGQSLLERRLDVATGEQVQQLRLGSLPAGVYTLQVTDGQQVSSRKVVKW